MSIEITDHRTIRDEADSTTNWTSAGTAGTSEPTPIESTARIGTQISTNYIAIYHAPGGTVDLSNKLVYAWTQDRAALDTIQNGGIGIYLGDGTNNIAFHKAGSDASGFRYNDGPVTWQNHVIDTSNLPTTASNSGGTNLSGVVANLNLAAIARVGVSFKTLAKSVGGAENCFIDIIRIGDPTLNDGAMVSIISGSSSDPGTFEQWATVDRQTGNQQAHGILRKLGVGAYGIQGKVRFGNATGTNSSWFEDKNAFVVLEDRGLLNGRYGIYITDNGTGTTTFKLGVKQGSGTTATGGEGVTVTIPIGVGGDFDSQSDTDVTDVFIYGSTFNGFTNGMKFGGGGQEFIGNFVNGSGTLIPSGTLFYNNTVSTSTATSSLYWNVNLDTNGYIDGCTFIGSGSTNHGIEYGPNTPVSSSLTNVFFTSYGSANTSASAIYNNSGKALQITISGGDTPTVRNGTGASTTLVLGLTQITLTGLVAGTEVRVLEAGTANELTGIESSGTSYAFSLSSGLEIDIVVHNIQYEYLRINNFTVPASDASIPIEQRFDRNYSNP